MPVFALPPRHASRTTGSTDRSTGSVFVIQRLVHFSSLMSSARHPLLVCTSHSASQVCAATADALPLWRYSTSKSDWPSAKVAWISSQRELCELVRYRNKNVKKQKKKSHLSKFLGSRDTCRKATFTSLMNMVSRVQPTSTLFWPTTYQLRTLSVVEVGLSLPGLFLIFYLLYRIRIS